MKKEIKSFWFYLAKKRDELEQMVIDRNIYLSTSFKYTKQNFISRLMADDRGEIKNQKGRQGRSQGHKFYKYNN